jgi:tetratricopeptide (TPR) repeat protein
MAVLTVLALLISSGSAEAQRRRRRGQQAAPDAAGQQTDGAAAAGGAAAAAQPAPSAEARQRARDLYAQGQTQFRAGQYTEALASFEAAYREVPNPVVLLGIAECHERMANWPQAAATLERYLAERANAPDRASVQARIDTARARPATLVVSSTPVGAAIAIDGNPTGRTTPAEIEVPPGDHTIVFSMEGHDDSTATVTATFGARHDVNGTLVARPAEPEQLGSEDDIFGGAGDPVGDDTPPPEVVDDDAAPSYTAAKIFAGIGGAALVAGTVLGFLALSEQSDFDAMPSAETADRGERLALFADVAFGVAAASLITGIILYLTEDGGTDTETDPSVAALPAPAWF